jgi:integration host factor subunit alpha
MLQTWAMQATGTLPPSTMHRRKPVPPRCHLTKAELAEMLFDQVGLNKRESKDMVEAFFDVIREALERGDSVKLSGFGNFQLRDKAQRPGRNPKTGEIIPITARRVVTFHASQKLKAQVEERAGLEA